MKTTLMNNVKKATVTAVLGTALFVGTATADAADMSRGANNFYTSEKVNVETVKFNNMYGMEIVGTLFTPKQMDNGKKYPALVVGHPFAAVRQQAANLYATKMAEAGFVTLSFDQMFWGESGGSPRAAVLPDLYVESFSAGVDYLGTRPFIDREKIGVIGICGSGGFAIAATKEVAPSRCYTDTAYAMAAEPKELVVIEGANRIDLYDRTEMIPWNKLTSFFERHLNK